MDVARWHEDRHAIQMVMAQRLGPLVSKYVGANVPSDVQRTLAAVELVARARVNHARGLLAEVGALLCDVPFVVLKGLAVGSWLYEDPVLRAPGDLDILIERRNLGLVTRRLVSAGFDRGDEPNNGVAVPLRRDGTEGSEEVDVHLRPWGGSLSASDVIEHAALRSVEGIPVRVPNDEVHLELLAEHYVHESGSRLSLLLDLILAWRRVRPRRCSSALRVCLRDANRLVGIPEVAPSVGWPWTLIDLVLARTPPSMRHELVGRTVMSFSMSLLTALVMRPDSVWATFARLIWPANPSSWPGPAMLPVRLQRLWHVVRGTAVLCSSYWRA